MAIFGLFNLFGGATVDEAQGDPDARNLLAQVRRGDMSGTNALLPALRDAYWDEREFYTSILAQDSLIQVLDAWCDNDPTSAVAHLLRGKRAIAWAWEARGSGTSDTVTGDGHALFQQRLSWAEQNFARAAQLDSADPTPHAYMIDCARGLGRGIEFGEHCFRLALERDSTHRHAHHAMLTLLTEKWGGRHDLMFRFARDASAAQPPGSELHELVLLAHVERWLHFSMAGDARGGQGYVRLPGPVQEAAAAYDQSLGSADHRPRRSTVRARSIAAFWFFLVGDVPRLRRELAALGGVCLDFPWCYFEGDPAKTFGRAKKLAG